MISQPVASRRRLAKHWLLRRGNPFTILFPMIGFGAGFASEFYINKSFFAFMIFSVAAILLCGIVQLIHALIGGGTELAAGLITVLLQTVLSVLPVMLLYLPFKEGGIMHAQY